MKLLIAVLCALIILLLIFVVTDSFTKLSIKRQRMQKERAAKKGEETDIVVSKVKTKEERIRENLNIKPTAVVGDSAVEVIRREKVFDFFKKGLCYAFLVVAAILVVIPFYWMFVVSLKTEAELELPNPTLLPGWKEYPLALSNFPLAMEKLNGFKLMANTIWVAICSTIGTLVTTVMAAFAFSRIKFKGRELLFTIFLATMMIPGEMMVITNFITVSRMKDLTTLTIVDGKVTWIVSGLAAGNYTVDVRYNGNDKYNISDLSETFKINGTNSTSAPAKFIFDGHTHKFLIGL